MKGVFISIEGIEGAGKTTHWLMLKNLFEKRRFNAVFVREPGGTHVSEAIRDILLNPQWNIHAESELFLYAASRAQRVREIIAPAVKDGLWVVSDRYHDATIAYQGYGRGLDMKFVKEVTQASTLGYVPQLTFILDVPAEKGMLRISNREPDRMEQSGLKFIKKVRRGYLRIAKEEQKRCVVIDAKQPKEKVFEKIITTIEERFGVNLGG